MVIEEENTFVNCAIVVRALTKRFGSRWALRGVELKVREGERLTIFGPNGAGKTTLMKILSTLSKPSSGDVFIDGIDIRDKPAEIRQSISLLSHHTYLYPGLSVYENLTFYGKMYCVPDLASRINEVISQVGLEARIHDRAGTLSRGLQQRASFARAILQNPSIVLLDEPETGLDPHAVFMMKSMLLGDEHHEKRTLILTSHNLDWGLEIGGNIAIINRGKIVYQADKREIDTQGFREIYNYHTG